MRIWKSWIVATKDFSVFRKNKYVFYSLIAIPLIVGSVMPATLFLSSSSGQVPLGAAELIVNLAAWYLVIIASILPTVIASYSFVGEKIEKSLEPLLAPPTTDSELLLGKSLAAFIPCMGATCLGAAISAILIDSWSYARLGTFLLPNWDWTLIVAIITPLACILSVETNVIISSRVNDVRAAQQLRTSRSPSATRCILGSIGTVNFNERARPGHIWSSSPCRPGFILCKQGNFSKRRDTDKVEVIWKIRQTNENRNFRGIPLF